MTYTLGKDHNTVARASFARYAGQLNPAEVTFVNPAGGSFELPLVYLALMIGLIATGPGRFSIDSLLWGSHNVVIERSETWSSSHAA